MAKKKSQKKKIKLTAPIIIFLSLVVIALVVVFVIFAHRTDKELKEVKYAKYETTIEGNEATLKLEIDGNATSYDIYYEDLDGNQIYAVKESKEFGKEITYTTKLDYNKEYYIYVVFNGSVLHIFDLTKGKTIANIKTEKKNTNDPDSIVYDNFQIHFMELGNDAAGDSVYIKAGDKDILIDAGSTAESALVINDYVKQYCTDGKLEYVIATHSHKDHISGFAGESITKAKNYKGETVGRTGVLYYYDVDTIIDFAYEGEVSKTNIAKGVKANDNKTATSENNGGTGSVYGRYLLSREYAVSNGTKHYTAKELWESNKRSFELSDGITMNLLYNDFYFNPSNDENNYSVCTMFNYNDHHFMMTGDLELEGEEALAAYYDGSSADKTLPHCDLFKAGHHGSKTSSNECLLEKITPDMCCVCCCAGSSEYSPNNEHQFPTQAFINRIAKYTDQVYITTVLRYIDDAWTYTSMNGNITVSCDGTKIGLAASNNLTKLKDTEWFNEKIYAVKTSEKYKWNKAGDTFDVYENCPKLKSKEFYDSNTPGAVLIPRRTWPTA